MADEMQTLREVEWVDQQGRHWARLIPKDAPDHHAALGMTLGPADIDPLGLPEPYATSLHNALYRRRIFTYDQAKRHAQDILSAIREAMAVDVHRVIALYEDAGADILALKPTEDAPALGDHP